MSRLGCITSLVWLASYGLGCARSGFESRGLEGDDDRRRGDNDLAADGVAPGGDAPIVTSPVYVSGVEIGFTVNDLVIDGTRLYAATSAPGQELQVYDAGDPTGLQLLGSAPLAGVGEGLAVVWPIVYAVGQGAQLELFSVASMPPSRLGGAATADVGYAVDVDPSLRRVYVTSAGGGDDLEIFAADDPAAPTKLGGLELQSNYYLKGVDAEGDVVYAAGQRLWAIEVTNPSAPLVLDEAGFYWYAEDLQVVGALAYGLESNNTGSDQLRIFDVSDPRDIVQLGAVYASESYTRSLAVTGATAYVVIDDYIDTLDVIDVSDSANPALVGFADLGTGGQAVTVSGDYVFVGLVAGDDEELRVYRRR